VTVGRDVVPVVTPAPVALVAVREPAASVTSRRVPAAAVVAVASATVTLPVVPPVASRGVATATVVLAVVAATAVALALPARPPLTLTVITPVTSRRVPATTLVLTVAAGPVGGSAVLGVASARLAVASRTALPLVETASGLGAGPVALAPGSSAGPAVAGMSVPTLVPGPVLERLGHVPLLCADAVPVGSRGCRRWPENGPP
jgi:hypothetical protein